jgi:hypothetical protein
VNLSAEDYDVIRKALALYLAERKRTFHRAAADADTEATLRLSLDYETDKEYVCGLIRRVGDGKMAGSTGEAPEPITEGSSND